MRSFLRTLFRDLVATIIVAGLSATVAYLGLAQHVQWYQLALGVIFAFAGSFFLVHQVRVWWSTRRITDDIWLSENISRWLLDYGFTLTKGTKENVTFHFVVQAPHKRSFSIYRLRDKKDDIRLNFIMKLTDEQQTAFRKLEDTEGRLLREDIHLEMIRLGVLYTDMMLKSKQIFVETLLPLDIHFDRVKVMQHALIMMRANVLISVYLKRAVRTADRM